jgi:F-type H+-transporting ATPase subunit c
VLATLLAAAANVDAGKAIALALGIGLGALGELQGIQWLGFALTEAVVFYGLIGGLLAYVLI